MTTRMTFAVVLLQFFKKDYWHVRSSLVFQTLDTVYLMNPHLARQLICYAILLLIPCHRDLCDLRLNSLFPTFGHYFMFPNINRTVQGNANDILFSIYNFLTYSRVYYCEDKIHGYLKLANTLH